MMAENADDLWKANHSSVGISPLQGRRGQETETAVLTCGT